MSSKHDFDPVPPAPHKDTVSVPPDKKLWQVRFGTKEKDGTMTLNGHGQQVEAASADDVKKEMAKVYGADYEIVDIVPVP